MHKRQMLIGLALLMAPVLSACGGIASPAAGVSGVAIENATDLIRALEDEGAQVETASAISQPFFSVEAQIIMVDGEEVQVFEFPDAASRGAAAELVSPAGDSIGTTMATWVSTPHFFQSGRLIALYVGGDDHTIKLLQDALGPQFAGG